MCVIYLILSFFLVDDTFSHIDFAELEREEAQKLIDKYSAEAKAAGHGQTPNKKPRQNGGGGGNRGHKNDRDSGGGNRRHGGRDRHRDSRGSNGHRSPRAYRDHRDRPSRPPLPHPSSNWSRGGGGGGGGGGGRGAPGGGGGGRGGGGWVNRGPPPPPMARNGPYMQRRGPPLPPPPPNRGGGWSAMAPADRSYGGARPDRGGGGAPPPRPYDDRRNDRPLYSQVCKISVHISVHIFMHIFVGRLRGEMARLHGSLLRPSSAPVRSEDTTGVRGRRSPGATRLHLTASNNSSRSNNRPTEVRCMAPVAEADRQVTPTRVDRMATAHCRAGPILTEAVAAPH